MIVLLHLSTLKGINLRPFSFLYNTNVFFLGIIVYKTNLRPFNIGIIVSEYWIQISGLLDMLVIPE